MEAKSKKYTFSSIKYIKEPLRLNSAISGLDTERSKKDGLSCSQENPLEDSDDQIGFYMKTKTKPPSQDDQYKAFAELKGWSYPRSVTNEHNPFFCKQDEQFTEKIQLRDYSMMIKPYDYNHIS